MSGTDFQGLPSAGALEDADVFALQRGEGEGSTQKTTLAEIKAAAGGGGMETGDLLLTVRQPDGNWLLQGTIYAQADYPELFALVGLIGDAPPGRYWTEEAVAGSRNCAAAWLDNDVVLWPGNGVINRSTDGGTTWTQVSVTGTFQSICALDDTTALACGNNGVLVRTTDAGLTWTPVTSGTTQQLSHIVSMTPLRAIVVGASRVVKYTSDGGLTWSNAATTSGLFDSTAKPICRLSHNVAIIASPGFKTTDGGITWSPMTYPEALGGAQSEPVAFDAETVVFLSSSGDKLFRTTNAGETWTVTDVASLALHTNSFGAVRITSGRALIAGAVATGSSALLLLDKGQTLDTSTTVLSGAMRYPSISPDGKKMLATAGPNIATSVPEYHYDTATLFKTPSVGDITGYIKA